MQRRTEWNRCILASLLAFALVFSSTLLIYPSEARRNNLLTVHPGGGAMYASIQDAIDAAHEGDTVYVYRATYYENLIITKSIILQGQDKNATIIDGANNEVNIMIHVSADHVMIRGFTLINSKQAYYSSGLVLHDAHENTISNMIITRCKDGLLLWGDSSHNTVYHNIFLDNTNHATDTGENNSWNLSYPNGGNYWNDVTGADTHSGEKQNDYNPDGIYDAPYQIPGGTASDQYPYVDPNGWKNSRPVAHANGPYLGYVNQAITFDGSRSYDVDGPINCTWDCGDGTQLNGEIVTYTYTEEGTYLLRLTVTDSNHIPTNETTNVTIWDAPTGTHRFTPSDDTYVYQLNTTDSFGDLSMLAVSNTSGNHSVGWQRDVLLHYDLSAIPSCIEITAATLSLYYYGYHEENPVGRTLCLHRLTSPWDEQTVTWKTHPLNTTEILATATIPNEFSWVHWDVTSDLQTTREQGASHEGWQITDETRWGNVNIPIILFKAKETFTVYAPYLEITYTARLMITTTGPYEGLVGEPLYVAPVQLGYGVAPYTWTWDFGDGTISTEEEAAHIYTTAGVYTITVKVEDSNGDYAAAQTTAVIKEPSTTKLSIILREPENALYLAGYKILSLRHPRIIGAINLKVTLGEHDYPITKVEYYIDDSLHATITEPPFEYHWHDRGMFGWHTLTIVVYDYIGTTASCSQHVWKLF